MANKPIVLFITSDFSGCSFYRIRQNAFLSGSREDLGWTAVVSPIPLFDENLLAQCRCIFYQRPFSSQHFNIIRQYKVLQPKYGYSIVSEADDLFWDYEGGGIPTYNASSIGMNYEQIKKDIANVLPMLDTIVCSTDYLARAFRETFGFANTLVIPNVVSRYLWGRPKREPITEDITLPRILCTQCPIHSSPAYIDNQGIVHNASNGDYPQGFIDYVMHDVIDGKIDYQCFGNPWFFQCLNGKGNYISHPWISTVEYPSFVSRIDADFNIAPLQCNSFNKAKSNLRFLESSICSQVFLGTDFEDSPYHFIHPLCKLRVNPTEDEIRDKINSLCKAEVFNEIIEWQWEELSRNGFLLESPKHLNLLNTAFAPNVQIQ